MGRCQRILQSGRSVVDIAMLYPIHDLRAATWFDGPLSAYNGIVVPPWADYQDVGDRLSRELRQDFTFLHPETLDQRCSVENGLLHLNQTGTRQDYKVLILPGSQAISGANMEVVSKFWQQGGQVIATTCLPTQSSESGQGAKVRQLVREVFGNEAAEVAGRAPRYPVVRASSVPAGFNPSDTPGCAVDGELKTVWSPDTTAAESWLEIELGTARSVRGAHIHEDKPCVTSHRIECWDGESWKTSARGEVIGEKREYQFTPTLASRIRLVIAAPPANRPRIAEFVVLDEANENAARLPQIPKQNNLRTSNSHPSGGRAWFIEQPTSDAIGEVLAQAVATPDIRWGKLPVVTGGNLTCCHKEIDGRQFFFSANSSDVAVSVPIALRGEMRIDRWNPHTGEMSAQPAEAGKGTTRTSLELPPVSSLFLVGR